MTHSVWFKFLLLLTFAVWMHQCETIDYKTSVLNDCCSFGRNRSKTSCGGYFYDFNSFPKSLQVECRSKIKFCCRSQRETDDCHEGILAAQNGSICPSLSSKYTICYKACLVGKKIGELGEEDCDKPVKGEERLEINARKTCCEQAAKETLLSKEDETDGEIDDEDDYGSNEEDSMYELTTSRLEEEITIERTTAQSETIHQTTTTTAETTTIETTTTPISTTNRPPDYDETTKYSVTTRYPTTTLHTNSLETNEVDTATTTRRPPPKYKNFSNDKTSASQKDQIIYVYEHPQHPENSTNPPIIYNYFHRNPNSPHSLRKPMVTFDATKFLESNRNSGNNPEPCGDIRYCDHSCIVTNGIQKCSCNPGYNLQRDGKTCLKADGSSLTPEAIIKIQKRCQPGHFLNDLGECQDIDECKIQNNGCGDKAFCRNIIGSYECVPMDICRTGYRYNENSRTCEDINECYENPRICEYGQICNNTVGSYTCEDSFSEFKARCEELVVTTFPTTRATTTRRTTTTQEPCHRGFERNYKGVCVDIDECIYSPCDQGLICVNRNGGYTCEVSHCNSGFKPEGRACVDIDECNSNPCPMTHNCINTHGSYACKMKNCPRGYRLDKFGGCEDINECHIYKNLCRNADCINTDGSYVCNCKAGYRKDEMNYCRDINECTENIHDCSHRCHNTFGGYQCYCDNGYRLNSDKKTCDDIDECRESGDFLCQGECENTLGGYECKCPTGFRKEESYCTDIDECQEYSSICDKKTSRCLNIPGSYKCMDIKCKDNYKLVRRNGERYCHLRTPCGDDDYEDACNQPWMYSYFFITKIANSSASNLFHLSIGNQHRHDVVIEDIRAFSAKENVKRAGFDDFIIQKISSGFFLASTRPIDGPQDIEIDVLVTFYRPDGSVEHKRGVQVKMVVSEFSFYKFSVRK